MKNYSQDGKTISFLTSTALVSGQAVLLGAVLVVAIGAFDATSEATGVTEGVFELPKKTTDDVAVGSDLYWDDAAEELTTTATDNTKVGKAWVAAANGDATVQVKINA
ncbi:DUF2190 family protein [Shewanella acanthi]|uniref:DUF2190 family protein n=1 Tax=Shewanella acanthi TaxID=2864212 RepID=UPI001C65D8DB|nr:capsid cement protein [Shewanella acanthi]QYJ79424.1 DUF2190 family protein [Shewanella acanthi]